MSSPPPSSSTPVADFCPTLDWELLRYDARVRMQRKIIKAAALARSDGDSLFTLIVPPGKSVTDVLAALSEEYVRESESPSMLRRSFTLTSLLGVQSRIRPLKEIPANGLVVFSGRVFPAGVLGETHNTGVHMEFEPFTPLSFFTDIVCRHGHTFQVELLRELFGPHAPVTFEQMERRKAAVPCIDIDPDKEGTPHKMPKAIVTLETRSMSHPCGVCRLAGKTVCNRDYIIIENFGDIAAALNRNPRHLLNNINDSKYAQASYDFVRRRAMLEQRSHSLEDRALIAFAIQSSISWFIRWYVLCRVCLSPNTAMDANFDFKCNNCDFSFSELRPVNRMSGLRRDDHSPP